MFCIAHELNDITGEGTNKLIKNGAHLVTKLEDITSKFEFIKCKEVAEEKTYKIPEEYTNIYKCIEENINTTNEIVKKLEKATADEEQKALWEELQNVIYDLKNTSLSQAEIG